MTPTVLKLVHLLVFKRPHFSPCLPVPLSNGLLLQAGYQLQLSLPVPQEEVISFHKPTGAQLYLAWSWHSRHVFRFSPVLKEVKHHGVFQKLTEVSASHTEIQVSNISGTLLQEAYKF